MLESVVWQRLSENAALLSEDPSNENARIEFWKSVGIVVDLRQYKEHYESVKLGISCKRDPHPGFRCILAAGHPGNCIFEETSLEEISNSSIL